MTERPILMSGAMVRATLREVDPKTQTRRVITPAPEVFDYQKPIKPEPRDGRRWVFMAHADKSTAFATSDRVCPYGATGDRLWVRENGWERPERTPKMMRDGADIWKRYYYDADELDEQDRDNFKEWGFKRRPSIHMPRWACRLVIEVTGVRVERLQDISEADAKAEGYPFCRTDKLPTPKIWYSGVWESINGKGSWGANPWVWIIEFRRVEAMKAAA